MPHLLIVNDDGIDSPMLPPLAAKLMAMLGPGGRVSIVVPAEEQSWKGKAMTRFGRIQARAVTTFGVPAFAVTGTPSDCVNLAVHHLLASPPDWVLSGINIGTNAGGAFVINSGTVGAALEGAVQGLPAVAFSTYLPPEHFAQWNTERRLTHPAALEIVETTTARTVQMMAALLRSGPPGPGTVLPASGFPASGTVLNINFPGAVTPDTPVRWVPMQDNRYGAVFRRDGDAFVHAAQVGLHGDEARATDRRVVLAGEISATVLSIAGLSAPPPVEGQRPF